jgi:hypothetical protein
MRGCVFFGDFLNVQILTEIATGAVQPLIAIGKSTQKRGLGWKVSGCISMLGARNSQAPQPP